jgi:uncharacterized protein (TIGR02147 family)
MIQGQVTGYRDWLKGILLERCRSNSKYSLRAMAASLRMSPALLSQILNGKRNLTLKKATQLAGRMKLSNRDRDFLFALVQFENAKDPVTKIALQDRLQRFPKKANIRNLQLDAFRTVSDWYHFAILQLLRLPDFTFTSATVALRLGIKHQLAVDGIERLQRLGIIEVNHRGQYQAAHKEEVRVESEVPNLALQNFHREMLQKAIDSLKSQSPQEKYVGSETIPIDVTQLPKIFEMINSFMDELLAFVDSGTRLSEVYHLNVSFFRLTKPEKRNV